MSLYFFLLGGGSQVTTILSVVISNVEIAEMDAQDPPWGEVDPKLFFFFKSPEN